MDDRRLSARLRSITDAVEPRPEFVDELHDTLAGKLGFPAPSLKRERGRARGGRPWLLLAATLAIAVALIGGGLLAGSLIERQMRQAVLLDLLREGGTIAVAVRPDDPQVIVPGGALGGFDIDVARALGDRLGLRAEIRVTPVDEMLSADSQAWDVAMLSTSLPGAAAARFSPTEAYYYWPFYVLVPSSSTASEVADLAGQTICVVAGSAGEAWLVGSATDPQPGRGSSAPANPVSLALEDDSACLAALEAGNAAAAVSATLAESDLPSRPHYRVVGESPAGWEGRTIVVNAEGGDPASLVAVLNEAIAALRADGTLRALSQSRFGGQDLSVPPR